MDRYSTIAVERSDDGVAWITLNRPEVHNAFNTQMLEEFPDLWRELREDDAVRCIVMTGAGEKAFCAGIDRAEAMADMPPFDPLDFEDPGKRLGPRSNQVWKPVIAAVNGMACGGAFYLLGEADFIIAAESATFFDPHLTYGMVAVYEPILLMPRMPFGEVMRMTLLGNHERLSARRACEVGLVTEVVPDVELRASVQRVAAAIASQPSRATQATVRALWAARELSPAHALSIGNELLNLGTDARTIAEGQEAFTSGERIDWRLR